MPRTYGEADSDPRLANPKAPLLLGAFGPVGLGIGALMSGVIGGRRRAQDRDMKDAALQGALGEGQLSETPLPALLDAAYKLEVKGIKIPETLADQIEFLQAETVAEKDLLGQEGRDVTTIQAQANAAQARVEADTELENLRLQNDLKLEVARTRNEFAVAKYKNELEAGKNVPGQVEYGPVGTGSVRVISEDGTVTDNLIPGSQAYQSAMEPVKTTAQAMDVLGQMIDEIETTGGEMFGASSRRQSILYQQAVSVIGELANAGVLQSGEAERFMGALPDPTGMSSRVKSSESLKAPYEELLRQLTRRQQFNLTNLSGSQLTRDMAFPSAPVGKPAPPPGTSPYRSGQ